MKNRKDKERLVIIGGGMAGTACLEEILKADPARYEITVFGAERHPNYNRVLLSQVLTGEKGLDDISLHGKSWYEDAGVRLYSGSPVTGIRRGSRTVVAANGVEACYDRLILATGAVPIVPPIPGIDKKGVFQFRSIDDCDGIRKRCEKGGRAVVIGGGLLGLEAAWGLKTLGMDVSVAHLMPRLMERQLDDAAAGFLKDELENAGIQILLGKDTLRIEGDETVEGIVFKDGTRVDAGVAVISIGIRPNIGLASSCGIYCGRGIVVGDTMQTYDPAVYAVGECVEHRGSTFGLVAPIFDQARVLANHLAGDSRLVFRNQPTSTRLKIPGIDLYSAGLVDCNAGAQTVEYIDRGERVYKKLVIEDSRIKGVLLYGDTAHGPDLFTSLISGEDVSQRRKTLLSGQNAQKESSVDAMPDDAIVCGCNGVTKKMIVDAIEKKGLFTREDVRRETKASSSCGGCAPLVDRILEATLGSDFQGAAQSASVCACTKYTRDDIIKNIREKRLTTVCEVMETLGWETVGCDTCRPAINYYLAMIWPDAAQDDQTSRLVNERMHANIQKDGTFSVVPRMYGGVATPEELKKVADAAVRYGAKLVKVTGGQRLAIIGVRKEDLPSVWAELGMDSGYAYGKALRTVKTCLGEKHCRYGTQDSLDLGARLEHRLNGLWMPAKVKLSVSGCPRNCSEAGIKDVGIVGVSGGWEIYVGGCGGIELKPGEHLATVKRADEATRTVEAFIQLYREEAHYGERTFKWVKRAGIGEIRKIVVDDSAKRKELCSRLDAALLSAADPWRARAGA